MSLQNRNAWAGLLYVSLWIVLSSLVIMLNKWILDRFPFAITITTWHMLFATIATQILARTTNLIDRRVEMNTKLYIQAIVPIGTCYSMSLILSNLVYLYLSMGYIQLLKAMGPVATLLACWSIGIRNPEPSINVLLTVCVIVTGVAISSIGELRFVLSGFLIQSAAVAFEAYKNALQQLLLTGKSQMGSMTLLYYFAPACTVINAAYILLFEYSSLQVRESSNIGPLIWLANGILTFGLNIASVTVIKKTSSVVLTLSGIPKSIFLVLIDMAMYDNPMTILQAVGFSIAGAGTFHYSRINRSRALAPPLYPVQKKEDPPKKGDEESQPLVY